MTKADLLKSGFVINQKDNYLITGPYIVALSNGKVSSIHISPANTPKNCLEFQGEYIKPNITFDQLKKVFTNCTDLKVKGGRRSKCDQLQISQGSGVGSELTISID
jgi:hypothetical protein